MNPTSKSPMRKVLFADGESLLRDVYVEEARRSGFEAVVASTGEECWELFEETQPDVLVSDLDLPGEMSGIELIAKVRETPLGSVIPVVAVSPGKREIRGVTDAVIHHDVDDYFEKPVHGERLLWRIRELVEGRPIGLDGAAPEAAGATGRAVMLDRTTDFMQGRVEHHDVAALFFSFFATGRSGKLCVMEGQEVIQLWFRRGWVVFAESNIEGMDFGDWLLQRGKLPPDALEAARAEWQEADRSLGVILVARGDISARTLFQELQLNVEAVIKRLFAWTAGNYYLEYSRTPAHFAAPESVSLQRAPAHYVMEGVQAHYGRSRCVDVLTTASGSLEVSPSAHFILRELAEPYYFENTLAQLGAGGTPGQLIASHPFDRDDQALSALTALWVAGGLLERLSSRQMKSAVGGKNGREERIRRAVDSVSDEHPDSRAAREARIRQRLDRQQEKRAQKRRTGFSEIMSALDKVSAEVAYENGLRLMSMAEYAEAARSLEEAVRLAPDRPDWLCSLAQAYLAQDSAGPSELDMALQTLKRSAALEPQNGEHYHWLGLVLIRMGHPDEARITLKRSIELGSEHVEQSRALLDSLG